MSCELLFVYDTLSSYISCN